MGRYSKRSISPVLFASRRVILPLAVLFAYGEWYLLRKFSGRIEYHCEAKPNNITTRRSRIISLRRSRNITHIAKRESFAKYLFALLSLFSANLSARCQGRFLLLVYCAASTIAVNLAATRDAPPIKPPSTCCFASSSAAFLSFMEPPY